MDKGFVLWFTGVVLDDMTEIARLIEGRLLEIGGKVELLDPENIEENLCGRTGSGDVDPAARIRSVAFVSELLSRNGIVSIVSCEAPLREMRDQVREALGDFVEVYVKSQKENSYEGRFEAPHKTEVELNMDETDNEAACIHILKTLQVLGFIPDLTGQEYSEDEEEEVKKRLEDLGYI